MNSQEFKTKETDYSKMKSVKIDAKTTLLVRPGTKIKECRKRFFERLKNSQIEAIHYKVLKGI